MFLMNEYTQILIIVASVFGFFMAWGVGANDVANAMGTSVGSKALTIRQAIIIATIFEFTGAFLAGGEVTETIRKGIVDTSLLENTPDLLIIGMLSSLLASGIWLWIATIFGWPVSTTHSIIGAIVGFAAVGIGVEAVHWDKIGGIAITWIISPLLSGFIAYALFRSVQFLILNTDDPFARALKYVPVYMFFTGFLISMVTFVSGLKHIGLDISLMESVIYAIGIGILVAGIGKFLFRHIKPDAVLDKDNRFASVERIFAILMIFTACTMAFAHGSNDVANAIGPVAAVIGVIQSHGDVMQESRLPTWVLLLGALGIVAGLITYGYKVIATIGTKITELTPSRGFAAELAAATTVVLASTTGIPISTTHSLVGAILGVGLARSIGAIDLRVVGSIFTSWLITLPAGAVLSILFFFIAKALFL